MEIMVILNNVGQYKANKANIQGILKEHKDPNIRNCFVSGFSSSKISKDVLKILKEDDDLAIRSLAALKLEK